MQKVLDCGALAQKLGVGDDIEEAAGNPVALDGAADPLVGVDRNRALFNDHLVTGQGARNLAGNRLNIGKIRVASLRLRRPHGDEDRLAAAGSLVQVGGEANPVVVVSLQQLGQMFLVDQHIAGLERRHLALIVVHAHYLVANLGKADRRNQANVPGTNHCYLNRFAHRLQRK